VDGVSLYSRRQTSFEHVQLIFYNLIDKGTGRPLIITLSLFGFEGKDKGHPCRIIFFEMVRCFFERGSKCVADGGRRFKLKLVMLPADGYASQKAVGIGGPSASVQQRLFALDTTPSLESASSHLLASAAEDFSFSSRLRAMTDAMPDVFSSRKQEPFFDRIDSLRHFLPPLVLEHRQLLLPPCILHLLDLGLVPLALRIVFHCLSFNFMRGGDEGSSAIRHFLMAFKHSTDAAKVHVRALRDLLNRLVREISRDVFADPQPSFFKSVDIRNKDMPSDASSTSTTWSRLPKSVTIQGSSARPLLFSFLFALRILRMVPLVDKHEREVQRFFADDAQGQVALDSALDFCQSVAQVYLLAYRKEVDPVALAEAQVQLLEKLSDLGFGLVDHYLASPNGAIFLSLPLFSRLHGELRVSSTICNELLNAEAKRQTRRSSRTAGALGTFRQILLEHDLRVDQEPHLKNIVESAIERHRATRALPHRLERLLLEATSEDTATSSGLKVAAIVQHWRQFSLDGVGERYLPEDPFSVAEFLGAAVVYLKNSALLDEPRFELCGRVRFDGRIWKTRWDKDYDEERGRKLDNGAIHGNLPVFALTSSVRPGVRKTVLAELLGILRGRADAEFAVWYTYGVYDERQRFERSPFGSPRTGAGSSTIAVTLLHCTDDSRWPIERAGIRTAPMEVLYLPVMILEKAGCLPMARLVPDYLGNWQCSGLDWVKNGGDWEDLFPSNQIYTGISETRLAAEKPAQGQKRNRKRKQPGD